MFVDPSPKNATATRGSPAHLERERGPGDRGKPAADDRVRAEVPALDVVEVHRAAVPVRAALDLSVELRHHLVRGRPARERVAMCAMRRGEDVAVLHRLADPDCDRLLADRDVEEPGQLARAEALLDLLLEVPDQEHLPEKLAQPLLGERSPLALDLRHDPESRLRAVRLVTQWVRIQRQLPEGWTDARLRPDAREREGPRAGGVSARAAGAGTLRQRAPLPRRPRRRRPVGGRGPARARAAGRGADPRDARARGRRRARGADGRHGARLARGGVGRGARRRSRPTGPTSTPRWS